MRGLGRSLAVAVTGTGLVLGAAHLPEPINLAHRTGPDPATAAHSRPVTQAQAICPGPEAAGGAGQQDSVAQPASVLAVAAPMQALPSGFATSDASGSLKITGLPRGGTWATPVTTRAQITSGQVSGAQSASVTGAGMMAPGTVATQRSWVKSGDSRGLVTVACMPAVASAWLIGGGGDPGRRERVVLTNPGPNPVTVDLAVLGVKGPITSPNGHGLVVGPYSRTVVMLDSIAGSEPSPVVHVTARGGEVAAVLNDAWLDGVVPRGGDDAVPVAGPSREQVIAGLALEGRATLRVAVPGDRDAVVQSRVLTPSGPKALPANGVTHLAAHNSIDIDLSALPPDAYAVQVRADVPVVAAAMIERRRIPGGPSDLAWSGASAPIRTLAGMGLRGPVDNTLNQRLDLAATGDPASVLVTTVGANGGVSTKEVAVAADSELTLPLDGATSVWVTPRRGVLRAAVVTWFTDIYGMVLSVTPLADLTLTTTPSPLRELRD